MKPEHLSLRKLQEMEEYIPGLAGFPSRILAKTYDEFINILYRDIDMAIYQLEENPELLQKDGEDRITIDIKRQLVCMGYNAQHDSKIGGHADLIVRKGSFLWIGEAKIHKSYDYLWEGFLQLSTRYSICDSNQKDGGILIYIRNEDAASVVQKWKDYLADQKLPSYSCSPCQKRDLAFFSTHKHEKSGKAFRIRHMPVILYFEPQDKSGRSSNRS
jgi:hypothetical protein